jgi:hypothetical protein
METSELKNTHILDYLQAKGHQPVKIKFGSAWYQSPLRQENTPSFKVDLTRNLWYDFGTGEGGDIISLIKKMFNCNFSDAVGYLNGGNFPVKKLHLMPADESGRIRLQSVRTLRNWALTDYLASRRIRIDYAKRFLKEASYIVHGKKYFAVAFINDLGGYELRNAFFKTGSSPKYFSTIPGKDDSQVNVFEGFMDFLSGCTYFNKVPMYKTIVLNSLSFLPKIGSLLTNTERINLFLDNDDAGRGATRKIMELYPQAINHSIVIYPFHKDFNEFLISKE